MEHNIDLMITAARAMSNLLEAMPTSALAFVRASVIPLLCAKLLSVEYLDLAEVVLPVVMKISETQPLAVLQAGGFSASFAYFEFYPITLQQKGSLF